MTRKERAAVSEERRLRRWHDQMDRVLRRKNSRDQSTRAPCRSRSRVGCGIASTSGMWLSNHAWSAAGSPAMPITSASPKLVRLGAKSAMSSQSLCAVGTIVSFTDTAMKPRGGEKPPSIHSPPPGSYGLRRIRHSLHRQRMWPVMPWRVLPLICRSSPNHPKRHSVRER
jgi:hypothetical protein